MSQAPDIVSFQIQGGVARVTLNRPAALNALDLPTIRRLREIVDAAATSSSVRSLLVTGAGRAFCAGGDVKQLLTLKDAESPQAAALSAVAELHRVISGLCRLPKPVIAAVNGPAAGAGVGLALSADVVWAASSASFALAFTAIGMSPDSGTTFLLPRAVGPKLAAELLLTNRRLSAEEALAAGLVSRVLSDDELLPKAEDLAARLAAGPTLAYARAKSLLRDSLQSGLETQFENERQNVVRSVLSTDFAEGVNAFVEKRRPEFKGE